MKENLNIGSRIDGYVEQTNNGVIEKHCYENSDANAEWTQLSTWLGGDAVAGGKMKEAGTGHWWILNSGATNSSGFTGLPGGWRINSGVGPQDSVFQDQYQNGYFWSSGFSALPDLNFSWARYLQYSNENVYRTGNHHTMGLSVRCIKDTSYSGTSCAIPTLTINHLAGAVAPVNKTVTYGTVTNIPGEPAKCWITSNLGADHQATAVNDSTEASAGWYWQFNRKQGYKHDGTTRTPNTTWITYISENTNWIAANDPCNIELDPTWHIPTSAEWYNVQNIGGWTSLCDAWTSDLKLHATGLLGYSDGSLNYRGSDGLYWSSMESDGAQRAWFPSFDPVTSYIMSTYNMYGMSIRCLREN